MTKGLEQNQNQLSEHKDSFISPEKELEYNQTTASLESGKERSKFQTSMLLGGLKAEIANPLSLSQEQGEQFAKNDSIVSDAVGGDSIDSMQNLANINAQINDIQAKISAIESKPNFGDSDKDFDDVDALNKKLLELKDLALNAEDKTTQEAIKAKQEGRQEAIKAKQEGRQEAIKNKQDERKQIIEQGNAEYARKQKIIDDKIRAIQSKIK